VRCQEPDSGVKQTSALSIGHGVKRLGYGVKAIDCRLILWLFETRALKREY